MVKGRKPHSWRLERPGRRSAVERCRPRALRCEQFAHDVCLERCDRSARGLEETAQAVPARSRTHRGHYVGQREGEAYAELHPRARAGALKQGRPLACTLLQVVLPSRARHVSQAVHVGGGESTARRTVLAELRRAKDNLLARAQRLTQAAGVRTRARTVSLVLFDEVELWDVAALCCAMSEAGRKWNWRPLRVHFVAAAPGPIRTRSQASLLADFSFDTAPKPDVLVVPGGFGARRAARDPQALEFCRSAAMQAEVWGAIGTGLGLLGRAGLLAEHQIACAPELAAWLSESCPVATRVASEGVASERVASEGVCESGPLLSVASSAGAPALALALVKRVLGARFAADAAPAVGQEAPSAGGGASASPPRLALDRPNASPLEGSPVVVREARAPEDER